jgi:hypothetical protein
MSDKELLELAAMAAGRKIRWDGNVAVLLDFEPGYDACSGWNPLADDGDALRLAIRIGMNLALVPGRAFAVAACGFDINGVPRSEVVEAHGSDPYAATRRAIVRAAASIRRAGKES